MVPSLYKWESQIIKVWQKMPYGSIMYSWCCRAVWYKLAFVLPASDKFHYISLLCFITNQTRKAVFIHNSSLLRGLL